MTIFNIYVPFDIEDRSTPPFRNLDLYFNRPNVRVVQSCNGLLLCCSNYDGGGSHIYFVFNPTTKQVTIVPSVIGGHSVRRTIRLMALAFHPNDCAHYKVVCVRALKHVEDSFRIQVYSFETCKRKISIESFYAHKPIFRNPVYWNGAVYWTPFYSSYLYFQLDVEQLQTLPLHEGLVPSKIPTMCFRESRGHLHLIVHNNHGYNNLCFNVYQMMSDHLGWFVKYQVQFDGLPYAFPVVTCQYWYYFRVVDVVRGEKEEDTFLVLVIPGKMVTYSIHDGFTEIYSRVGYNFEDFSNVNSSLQRNLNLLLKPTL